MVWINLRSVVIGPVPGRLERKFFADPRRTDVVWYLVRTYAPFERKAVDGDLSFHGEGKVKAGPVEQRMVFEWARQTAAEAAGGQGGLAYGLVLAWHLGELVARLPGPRRRPHGRGGRHLVRLGRGDPGAPGARSARPALRLVRPPEAVPGRRGPDRGQPAAGCPGDPPDLRRQGEAAGHEWRAVGDPVVRRRRCSRSWPRGGEGRRRRPSRRRSAGEAPAEPPPAHLLLPPAALNPRVEEVVLQLPEKPPAPPMAPAAQAAPTAVPTPVQTPPG